MQLPAVLRPGRDSPNLNGLFLFRMFGSRKRKFGSDGWFSSVGNGLVALFLMWGVLLPMSWKDSNSCQLMPIRCMGVAALEDFAVYETSQAGLAGSVDSEILENEPEIEVQNASVKQYDKEGKPDTSLWFKNQASSRGHDGIEEMPIPNDNAIKRRRKADEVYYNSQKEQIEERTERWKDKDSFIRKKEAGVPNKASSTEQERGNVSKNVRGMRNPSITNFSSEPFSVTSDKSKERDLQAVDNQEKEAVEDKDDELKAYMHMDPDHSLGEPITDWDRRRQQWLENNPQVKPHREDGKLRLFVLSGSQPSPCLNPHGDHILLRCLKNKIDYCRLHGIDILYNMALLDPSMPSFWAKLPLVRATMLSHPEAEWIWWVDSDAIVTDMEYEIPLEKHTDYNFIVYGWDGSIFEAHSWVGLNAGSFLIRNCQWSMDFMERWAAMGPQAPLGEASAKILSDFLPDRPFSPTDDQSVLVYLLIQEWDKWGDKVLIQTEYALSGYWIEEVDKYESTEENYQRMESEHDDLKQRNTEWEEKLASKYGRMREKYLMNASVRERRPFVTHFTGCQPCSGHNNQVYEKDKCMGGMVRALNYADDQVLRSYGYHHHNLEVPQVEGLSKRP
eukprot:c21844_g1_i1 orf=269-2119(-)